MKKSWKRTVFCAMGAALLTSRAAEMNLPDYHAAAGQLEAAIREEMNHWGISGVAVALIDGDKTVYSAGFGEAKRSSVFRCGSISKLFNAVAVMQLVESGKLDLDAPVTNWGTGLLPVNPFSSAPAVTMRQILCHRSGMIREAPVGGYFDDSEPGLARTVASVAQATLPSAPNQEMRYSNVGPSIAGRIVELVSGKRFEQYQREQILGPLGMKDSVWTRKALPRGRMVSAYMRVAQPDGSFRHEHAPVFDLGTLPAGNLFTTADDLARFVAMLAAGGQTVGSRILKSESLEQMFTLQDAPGSVLSRKEAGQPVPSGGFGLGFAVAKFRDNRLVSHGGAVYGNSSLLAFLPEAKIGVVILANEDTVNGRVQKLGNLALSLMLEAKFGEKPPATPGTVKLSKRELAEFAGEYESQSFWANLEVKNGRLIANISGQPAELTPVGALRFLADSRTHDSVAMEFERNAGGEITGFAMGLARIGRQEFRRVPQVPQAAPEEWRRFVGSYGPGFIPLIISIRHGRLYAMTENLADYRLTPVNREVFAFPPGLYTHEYLVFLTGRDGKAHSVDLANMILKRR